jgi:hypothetical protein
MMVVKTVLLPVGVLNLYKRLSRNEIVQKESQTSQHHYGVVVLVKMGA